MINRLMINRLIDWFVDAVSSTAVSSESKRVYKYAYLNKKQQQQQKATTNSNNKLYEVF